MTFDNTNERNAFLDSTPIEDAAFNVCSCSQENYDLSNWGETPEGEPEGDTLVCEVPQDTETETSLTQVPEIVPQESLDYEDDIIQL